MRPIAADGLAWCVSVSVCLCVDHNREPCKTAEPIETRLVQGNHVLDGGCAFAPPGEYVGSLCVAAAIPPFATIAIHETFSDWFVKSGK